MTRLIADIGGTSLRLAHQHGDDPALCDPAIMACADFATAEDAFAGYCAKHRLDIDMLCLAVASPVNGAEVDITNNHWQFDAGTLAAAMNLRAYLLINDFTAQAMAHRDLLQNDGSMPASRRQILRDGTADQTAPLLVIGPGTGLGVAALVPAGDDIQVIEGEGGHVSYAPRNPAEDMVLAHLAREFGHVSAERIVSGPGIELIYHCQTGDHKSAPDIGALALAGDAAALSAVRLMLQSLGTVASNAALSLGARAGVVIAGGIAGKLAALLGDSGLIGRFDDHGRRWSYLHALPIYLSIDPLAGLRGAAAAIDNCYLAQRITLV
jgi:glucokinase